MTFPIPWKLRAYNHQLVHCHYFPIWRVVLPPDLSFTFFIPLILPCRGSHRSIFQMSYPFSVVYVVPKNRPLCVTFRNILRFLWWRIVSPSPNLQEGGPPGIGCPRIRMQYIYICAAAFHIWRPSPTSSTQERGMPWWQGPHSTEYYCRNMRMYPEVSGLAAWSENCKWYSSLPLGAAVSLFCELV
jgi:hypothetical protein